MLDPCGAWLKGEHSASVTKGHAPCIYEKGGDRDGVFTVCGDATVHSPPAWDPAKAGGDCCLFAPKVEKRRLPFRSRLDNHYVTNKDPIVPKLFPSPRFAYIPVLLPSVTPSHATHFRDQHIVHSPSNPPWRQFRLLGISSYVDTSSRGCWQTSRQ